MPCRRTRHPTTSRPCSCLKHPVSRKTCLANKLWRLPSVPGSGREPSTAGASSWERRHARGKRKSAEDRPNFGFNLKDRRVQLARKLQGTDGHLFVLYCELLCSYAGWVKPAWSFTFFMHTCSNQRGADCQRFGKSVSKHLETGDGVMMFWMKQLSNMIRHQGVCQINRKAVSFHIIAWASHLREHAATTSATAVNRSHLIDRSRLSHAHRSRRSTQKLCCQLKPFRQILTQSSRGPACQVDPVRTR